MPIRNHRASWVILAAVLSGGCVEYGLHWDPNVVAGPRGPGDTGLDEGPPTAQIPSSSQQSIRVISVAWYSEGDDIVPDQNAMDTAVDVQGYDTGAGEIEGADDAQSSDTGTDSLDTDTPGGGDNTDETADDGGVARMTGGGAFNDEITHRPYSEGFTVHCEHHDSNHLEINWGSDSFHMTSAWDIECFDGEGVDEGNPHVGWDTVTGYGRGRLGDGTEVTISFAFIDDGEPGRGRDSTLITFNPGTEDEFVVSGYLARGNHQAHGALPVNQ